MDLLIGLVAVLVIFIPFLLWAVRRSAHQESVKGEQLGFLSRVRLSLGDVLKDKWFTFTVIATVFLGLCIVFSGGVYTAVGPVGGIGFYRVNRFTGETWLAIHRRAFEVEYKSKDDVPPPPAPPLSPAAPPSVPE